jgi:hypothetical protein
MVPQLQKQWHGSDFTVLLDRAAFVNVGSQNRILDSIVAREEIWKGARVPGGCLHNTLRLAAECRRAQQMAVSGWRRPSS